MDDIADIQMTVDARSVDAGTKSLDRLDKQSLKTEKSTDKLNRETTKTSAAMTRMSSSVGRLVGGLAAVVTTGAAIRGTVTTIRDFTEAMSKVEAISRASGRELETMTKTARQLGATTSFSATQAAEGMTFLSMAGFTAQESISAIPDVLDLAKASALDLGTAADIASNVMSGFGIEATKAGEAADILAAISSRANTNVYQLGDAASYVGPVARAMGISLGDASAAIGVLSDAGIQGSSAGTGLRRVLSSLANPTKDATEVLRQLGVNVEDVNPATNELTDVINRLSESGLSAADALTIFGDRGGPAVLALTANNERVAELAEEMKKVEGEAKRMAETMDDNLSGDVKELQSAMSELALQIGDAGLTGALRGSVQWLTEATRAMGFLVDETRALFGVIDDDDFARLDERVAELKKQIAFYSNEGVGAEDSDKVKKLKAELDEAQKAYDNYFKSRQRAAREQEFNANAAETEKRLAAARKSIMDSEVELAQWKRTMEDAARVADEEFNEALEDILNLMDPNREEALALTEQYEFMEKAMKEGKITAEQWADFLDYAFPEVVVEAKKVSTEIETIGNKSDVMATAFERGIERMRDGVGDFFEDVLVNGEASFDGLLDLFKKMVAEMIATAAANQIFMSLGITGSGGVMGAAGNVLSNGGTIMDLFTQGAGGLSSLTSLPGQLYTNLYGGMTGAFHALGMDSLAQASYAQASNIAGMSGMQQAGYGLLNAGAGFAGNYVGQEVFGGNTTGIGSGVGGAIGSIWGPIGTAIGSFLGEGFEVLAGNVFGFGGTSNNRVSSTYTDGVMGDIRKHGNGRHKEQTEAVEGITGIINSFIQGIGGTTADFKVSASAKHGLELNGDQLRTKDTDKFLGAVFKEIIMGADQLSDTAKVLVATLDEGAEGMAEMAAATAGIDMMLQENPVTAVMKEINRASFDAGKSSMDIYREQLDVVRQMGAEFDGTSASATNLYNALGASQQAAAQMAVALDQVRKASTAMLYESAESIRESVMSEEDLFVKRKAERNELQKSLREIDDINELQRVAARIEELNSLLFNSIDDPTEAQAEQFAQFAETSAEILANRTESLINQLTNTQQEQSDRIQAILENVAQRQAQATDQFANAVDSFDQLIQRYLNNPTSDLVV